MGSRREEQTTSAVIKWSRSHIVGNVSTLDIAIFVSDGVESSALAGACVIRSKNSLFNFEERVDILRQLFI